MAVAISFSALFVALWLGMVAAAEHKRAEVMARAFDDLLVAFNRLDAAHQQSVRESDAMIQQLNDQFIRSQEEMLRHGQ